MKQLSILDHMQNGLKRYLLYSARKINSKFGMTYKKTDLSRKKWKQIINRLIHWSLRWIQNPGRAGSGEESLRSNKIHFCHEIPCEWLMQGETSLVRSLSSPET